VTTRAEKLVPLQRGKYELHLWRPGGVAKENSCGDAGSVKSGKLERGNEY